MFRSLNCMAYMFNTLSAQSTNKPKLNQLIFEKGVDRTNKGLINYSLLSRIIY